MEKENNVLYEVYTATGAARAWGLNESTVRQAIKHGIFNIEEDYRKDGRVTLIKREAMDRVYNKTDIEILEHDEWISVHDRLPDDDKQYLTYCDVLNHNFDKYRTANYSKVGACWSCEYVRGTEVTHWRILPPPPEDKKSKINRE